MSAQPVEGGKRRADAGRPRQMARDSLILEWLAEQGTVPMDLLAAGILQRSLSTGYAMVTRWKKGGWAETGQILSGPTWVWLKRPTARRYLGWDPGDWAPTPAMAAHYRAVAAVRLHLGRGPGEGGWISERQLRHELAGYRTKGQQIPHMPDGVWIDDDGREWAVEVELSPKGRERTAKAISDGYSAMRDTGKAGVIYFAPEAVARHLVNVIDEVARERSTRGRQSNPDRELEQDIRARVEVRPIEEVPLWR